MGHLVGIDLGTTNSAIAFTEVGRQRCLQVEKDHYTNTVMPSCIAMSRRGEWLVGSRALRERGDTAREFKRRMGEDFEYQVGDKLMSPVELSAMVLRKLKESFEAEQGTIDGAVITVPAMFNEIQRRETIEAGRLAGLNVLRVINEPSSAAIAYTLSDQPPEENAVVIDWGGGTLDVSLLDCEDEILDVKSNAGDMKLGGKDVDELLLEILLDKLEQAGHDLRSDRVAVHDLNRIAEKIKIRLSEDDVWDEPLHLNSPPHFFEIEIHRRELEKALSPLLDRVFEVVQEALERNPSGPVQPDQVNDIILVGGSCLIPVFQWRVKEFFGRPGRITADPMEVVALGAAYQARHAESSESAEIITVHSLTMNLGTSCAGEDEAGVLRADLFSCLLQAGTKIPARATNTYGTIHDFQDSVEIDVFELPDLVERVDTIEPWDRQLLNGLPPVPAGSYPINLTFDYQVDQTLTVTVSIPDHGIERTWVPMRLAQLEQGHDESQQKIDEAFDRSLKRLSDLATRAREAIEANGSAPESTNCLARFEEAIEGQDLDSSIQAKEALMQAMFDEDVQLGGGDR